MLNYRQRNELDIAETKAVQAEKNANKKAKKNMKKSKGISICLLPFIFITNMCTLNTFHRALCLTLFLSFLTCPVYVEMVADAGLKLLRTRVEQESVHNAEVMATVLAGHYPAKRCDLK
jgi:multisubunit Na+/H+ antiporter MnhG subunit